MFPLRRRYVCHLAVGFATLSAALLGIAQTERAESEKLLVVEDEVFQLNPFVVQTERDVGFVAASSLAGGRLAGDLNDTPIAYSVLTGDFIEALQLTDVNEMMKWVTNSSDNPDMGDSIATGTAVRIQSRGIGNSPQRNFFPVYFNFDGYNLERLDVARGPNAVLFGTTGVGGTANSVTKRAHISTKPRTEIKTTYGSWENYRVTLDHNQALGDTFAVRLNALYQDRRGWRDAELERKNGVTLASVWRPLRNTEIRAEAEWGEQEWAAITTYFDDNISGWAGQTYSARLSGNTNAQGVSAYGANAARFIGNGSGGGSLYNFRGWAYTRGGNAAAAIPAGGVIVTGPTANINNQSIGEQINLPESLYDIALNNSNFRMPDRKFSTYGDRPNTFTEHDDFTLSITQRIGERVFVEVAGNKGREELRTDTGITRGMSRILLDVNTVMPDGSPNPNFLEPYVEMFSYPYEQFRDKENLRYSVGYVLDDTKWGDFKFNLSGGYSNQKYDRNSYVHALKSQDNPILWSTALHFQTRIYYQKDDVREIAKPGTWTYLDSFANTQREMESAYVRVFNNESLNQVNDATYEYLQAAVNAKLLKGKLNLVAAVRQDRYETSQKSPIGQYDNSTDWDGVTRYFKPDAPADWTRLTYRLRDSSGNPYGEAIPAEVRPRVSNYRDPLYANDRFQDDYSPPNISDDVVTSSVGAVYHLTNKVSVFANYAESFVPASSAVKINGSLFDPRSSYGTDLGLRFTLLDGGIVATLSRYEGRETNATTTASALFPYNQILRARPLNDLTPGNYNARGLAQVPTGYVDSMNTTTEGWEFEVTANITRNWRLSFNASVPEAYQTNRNAESVAYFKTNEATLRQIIVDAGGSFNGEVAVFTSTVPPGQNADMGPNAVNAWNTIRDSLASIGAEAQERTRVNKVLWNLYTDYDMSRFVKGLRLGAGLNHRGKQVIGFRGSDTIVNPNNPAQAIDDPSVNEYTPVYSDSYTVGTLTASYTHRIMNKYSMTYALKIDNLFDYEDPIYINTIARPANGDLSTPARVATPNRYYWLTPRNYTLSASLRF